MAAVFDGHIVAKSIPTTQGQRPFVVHRETRFRNDIEDSTEAVSVLRGKPSRHHIHRLNDVGAQSRRKNRVGILPE